MLFTLYLKRKTGTESIPITEEYNYVAENSTRADEQAASIIRTTKDSAAPIVESIMDGGGTADFPRQLSEREADYCESEYGLNVLEIERYNQLKVQRTRAGYVFVTVYATRGLSAAANIAALMTVEDGFSITRPEVLEDGHKIHIATTACILADGWDYADEMEDAE